MITRKQYREAMTIVDTYCSQVSASNPAGKLRHEIGCRVRLNKFGIETQGKRAGKLLGTTMEYIPWVMNPLTDGTVSVKWDGRRKPEWMHISHIEAIK